MRRYLSVPFSRGRTDDRETLMPTRPTDAPPPYSDVVASAPPLPQGGAPPYSGPPPAGYSGPPPTGYHTGYQYGPYAGNTGRKPDVIVLRDEDAVERPMVTFCHSCCRNVVSRVSYTEGGGNEGLLCLTSLVGCLFWPVCLLLPFCLLCDRESSAIHYCPRCHTKLAQYAL